MNYIQQYLELIPSFPFVIQVALWFIFVNAIAILVFMLVAVFIRRSKRLEDELVRELYPQNIKFLQEVFNSSISYSEAEVFNKYSAEVENATKKDKLKKKAYPALISAVEDLITKDNDLTENKNYHPVILGLKIDEYLFKKLTFTSVRNRLRIFQTLSILGLTAPDSALLPFTHSRNLMLRRESRSSYVAISNNDPFKFFDQADNSLNQWDTISMMQQLENHHKDNLPSFSKWIKYSQNPSQLLFVIKAAAHFNQTSAAPALLENLEHDDRVVRKEVITALGDLRIAEAEQPMMEMYRDQPEDCQNAIVTAVLSIKSGSALSFLEKAYEQSTKLETKKVIAEAIYSYDAAGEDYVRNMLHTKMGFERLILEHVKNPLIPKQLRPNIKASAAASSNLNFNTI
jgi:hypothetical protein